MKTETFSLPAGVRGDDIKRHPVYVERGAYYLDQVGFDPSGKDRAVRLNTWQGWPMESKEGKCERLLELLRQGATPTEFGDLAREALSKGIRKPWGWVLSAVEGRRADAARIALAPPPLPKGDRLALANASSVGVVRLQPARGLDVAEVLLVGELRVEVGLVAITAGVERGEEMIEVLALPSKLRQLLGRERLALGESDLGLLLRLGAQVVVLPRS